MEGRFLGGAVLGGIVGAALATNWDRIAKKCPCLASLHSDAWLDEMRRMLKNTAARPKKDAYHPSKTRLMARRYRTKKD